LYITIPENLSYYLLKGIVALAIERKSFDSEDELHSWVEKNIGTFFGDVIYVKGFKIATRKNKGGIPDGFVLDLNNSSWTIIESELINHGVWDHIAEQIVRFIVASQNSYTKKKIRDRFFEEITNGNLIDSLSEKLQIPSFRLLQEIENITESTSPEIAIFIDDSNEDLMDMAEAMNAPIKIYRVQKYLANGSIEYLSPDSSKSYFETTVEDVKETPSKPSAVVDFLGGGKLIASINKISIFELNSGERITTKYSKYYENSGDYWYGITPTTFNRYKQHDLTHIVFILGDEGFVKLPIEILEKYLKVAKVAKNPDGTVKLCHVIIKAMPEPLLYINKNEEAWELSDYFISS